MSENVQQSSVKESPDFLDYLELILRRKKMIMKVTIPVFILSLVVSLLSSPVYESTARILPPQQEQVLASLMMGQMGGGLSSLAGGILGTGTQADQYASILVSERIKDVIIDRFNLMEEYKNKYRVKMYKKMDKIVKVKAGKKDGIITITAEDEDPKKAADIANAYIEELGNLVAEMSISAAGLNNRFIEGRLGLARVDLARAEEALNVFQSKNMAISVTDQAKATIEGVVLLKAQLATQEVQLSSLRSQFTDSTQEVQNIKAAIINLKSQIARLEGSGTGAIPSIGSIPDLGQEQIRLLREFKIQEMLVELLTKQNEMAKLTEAKNINTIQVIQKARVPDKNIRLSFRKRHVIMLTFLTFSIAIFWVLLQDYLNKMPVDDVDRWKKLMAILKER